MCSRRKIKDGLKKLRVGEQEVTEQMVMGVLGDGGAFYGVGGALDLRPQLLIGPVF